MEKLTLEQRAFILSLQEAFPEINWRLMATSEGYDHMREAWNYYAKNIAIYKTYY